MRTRNRNKIRKTRKIRGGGIVFDGVWKAEPGITGDRLAYSNSEASFLNVIRIGYLQNELTWLRNTDAVRDAFLALDTGNILEATTPEEMRQGGYTDMLSVIGSLSNAVTRRALKDKEFETISTIVVIDRGRQTERTITDIDKRNHRERTEVLAELLKVLTLAKKPYDDKYNRFAVPSQKPQEKPKLTFTVLPVEEGVDLPAENTTSRAPQLKSKPKDSSTFEEQLAHAKAEAEDRCEGCGKTETVVRAETGKGLSACSRCKSVKYCGPVCQKACWKEHKPFCIPLLPSLPPPLPPLDYVATLPFYVEDIRSLAFLNHPSFNCHVITKTQLLVFTNSYKLYLGPYVLEKKEGIEYKDTEFKRKAKAVGDAFQAGKIPRKELEEGLMQLVREANTEENKPVLTDEKVEELRREGQKAKSTSTILQKYREKMDALKRDISVTNENMDTLITYLDSQKNPFIKSELATLKVKYGSLQRTDALVEDIKTMLIETQKKLAQKSVDKLLEQVDQFYQVRKDLKKATELYEAEKVKYEAFRAKHRQVIHEYENLTEIGIPLHSPAGLITVGNNILLSMNHFMYDIERGLKIGTKKGIRWGTPQTCQLDTPTDMSSENENVVVCVDSGNHLLVFYNIQNNTVQFMPPLTKPIAGYVNDEYGRDARSWRFNRPMGIASYQNYFFIADTGNDCIRKIEQVGSDFRLTTIAGRQPGEKESILKQPMSICIFGDSVIVADTGNHCIRKLTKQKDGSYQMNVIAGTPGTAGYRNGRDSLFSSPCKVAVWNGNIYVADRGNSRIRVIVDHTPREGEFPKNLIV